MSNSTNIVEVLSQFPAVEYRGQRVASCRMIDEAHGLRNNRTINLVGTLSKPHQDDNGDERPPVLVEGEHFFRVPHSEWSEVPEFQRHLGFSFNEKPSHGSHRGDLVVLTEMGYLLTAKRFRDRKSDAIFQAIFKVYFAVRGAVEQGIELQLRPDAPIDVRAIVDEASSAAAEKTKDLMIAALRQSATDLVAQARATQIGGEAIPNGSRLWISALVRRMMIDDDYDPKASRRVTEGVVTTLQDKEFVGKSRVYFDPEAEPEQPLQVRKSAPAFPMWYVHEQHRDLVRKVIKYVLAITPGLKRNNPNQRDIPGMEELN